MSTPKKRILYHFGSGKYVVPCEFEKLYHRNSGIPIVVPSFFGRCNRIFELKNGFIVRLLIFIFGALNRTLPVRAKDFYGHPRRPLAVQLEYEGGSDWG